MFPHSFRGAGTPIGYGRTARLFRSETRPPLRQVAGKPRQRWRRAEHAVPSGGLGNRFIIPSAKWAFNLIYLIAVKPEIIQRLAPPVSFRRLHCWWDAAALMSERWPHLHSGLEMKCSPSPSVSQKPVGPHPSPILCSSSPPRPPLPIVFMPSWPPSLYSISLHSSHLCHSCLAMMSADEAEPKPRVQCPICHNNWSVDRIQDHLCITTRLCDVCGKDVPNKSYRRHHDRCHNKTRPSDRCSVCGSSVDHNNKARHLKTRKHRSAVARMAPASNRAFHRRRSFKSSLPREECVYCGDSVVKYNWKRHLKTTKHKKAVAEQESGGHQRMCIPCETPILESSFAGHLASEEHHRNLSFQTARSVLASTPPSREHVLKPFLDLFDRQGKRFCENDHGTGT